MHLKKIFLILILFALLTCICVGVSNATDSSTIVQGEKYSMKGEATGSPGSIQWYLFGSNYFKTGVSSVTDGVYDITLSKTDTETMDSGQYYLIIQHPMYDKTFNVGPVREGDSYVIKVNNHGSFKDPSATTLFNVNGRQGANAVRALEDAIKSQNIDDMLATTTLTVIPKSANTLPSSPQVFEGNIYSVTGNTVGHVNDMVRVEFSGAGFVPQSKETPSSSGMYREASTRIGESGTWKVDIDTTGLNPGTYTVTVYVGSLSPEVLPYTVEVVKQSATPIPTYEPSPVLPTPTSTPVSPGFGVLALLGLAGVLLLKRK